MKRLTIVAFHLTLIAVGWFIMTWFFFNSMALSEPIPGGCGIAADDGAPGPRGRHHLDGMPRAIMEELNLSDDQKEQIRSIFEAERSNIQPLFEELRAGRDRFRSLNRDGEYNEDQVRDLAAKQASIIAEMMVTRQRIKSRISAILTPDQRGEAEKMLRILDKSHHGRPAPFE